MTFVVLRTQMLLGDPFYATETVQGSSLLSGVSKMDSHSAPHQVCAFAHIHLLQLKIRSLVISLIRVLRAAFSFSLNMPSPACLLCVYFNRDQGTRDQTLTGQIT